MTRIHIYICWILVALALAATSGATYFARTITQESVDRATALKHADERASKQAAALRIRTLAKESATDRAALVALADVDLISAVDLIDAAGTAAGVHVDLSQALSEGIPKELSALGVRPVGFVVQAAGSFSDLMHLEELFEHLPVLSSVERLDIEKVPDANDPQWHMSAYIRVYTKTDISS